MSDQLSTHELPSRSGQTPLITVLIGDRAETRSLESSVSWLIGRSERAELFIDDPSVSREHARLAVENGVFSIEDLGSANGTIVKGARIEPHRPHPILPESPIHIGEAVLLLRFARLPRAPRRLFPHAHLEAALEDRCRARKTVSLLLVDIQRDAAAHDLEEPLTALLGPRDLVAGYAPNRFELMFEDTDRPRVKLLADRIERMLSDRGIVAKLASATAPFDGHTADALVARASSRLSGAAGDSEEAIMPGGELGRMIERLAPGSLAVLLTGETGSGKEVVAKLLHRASSRRDRPFVHLDCATLSPKDDERIARAVEQARGSTLFFDEVGELALETQARVLSAINQPAAKSVRLVSATHHELPAAVERAAFRQDLFFRLNGMTLVVPPLRERTEEIAPLAEAFLARASRELGRETPAISPAALELLLSYPWPGNVRELANVIERGVLLADGGDIGPEHLPLDKLIARWVVPAEAADPDRERILATLEACGGNQSRAARELGMSRGAFLNKLSRYSVPRPRAPAKKSPRD